MKKKITQLCFTLISLCITLGTYAQIGYNCDSANVITGLPYSQTGFNTNTTGNPYTDTNACASAYMNGNDYVFSFTPAYNMNVSIVLSNTGQAVGLFVADKYFEDTLANCVSSATAALGNPSLPNVALLGGTTYYILISTNAILGANQTTAFDIAVTELLQIDASVTSITSPVSGCDLGLESVIAQIENLGVDSLYNFDLTYDFNGATNTELITDTILPGGNLVYTFVGQVQFTAVGNYTLKVYADLTLDGDNTNDTATVIISNLPVISSFPYIEDFENGTGYWHTGGTNSSWALGTPADSIINHAASPTNAWKTNLTDNHNANENSYVESPCFDFTSLIKPIIDLNIWTETAIMGAATLQSSVDNGASWQVVGANGDPNNWYNGTISTGWNGSSGNYLFAKHLLTGLGGQANVKFRIAFNSGIVGSSEGVAFDDIHIYDTPADDIGVVDILSPTSGCGLGSEMVVVTITNYGTASQSGFPVAYSIDGGSSFTTETVSATLLPDSTLTYQFSATASLGTAGTYDLVAMTTLTGDADNSNDTAFATVINGPVISTFPYTEDFDGANSYWTTGGSNSSWALGTPAKPLINYAASSPNSWVTSLTGNHNANEDSWVEGPCMDFTSLNNPYVRLDVWTETSAGAGTLEVSTDFGSTWTVIGANGDPFNWYTGSLTGGTGWSGSSAGDWSTAVHKLDGLSNASSVKLRIHYDGGLLLTSEGMAFDNVEIFECVPPTAGFTSSVNVGAVAFTNTSVNATSYQWSFGDGGSSTLQDPTHNYTAGGTYPVTLIVYNDCESDTIVQNVSVSVGIDEFANINNIGIYPNPTKGECLLTLTDIYTDNSSLTLTDARGAIIFIRNTGSVNGTGTISVDLTSFAKGVYYLKFSSEIGNYYSRIIVE